jgi:glycerol uptake facilitator-like aquaporin
MKVKGHMARQDRRVWHRLLADSVSTFCLVLLATAAAILTASSGPLLDLIGVTLAMLFAVVATAFALRNWSRSRFSPMVSTALSSRGHALTPEVSSYVIAQCAAAIAASVLLRAILSPGSGAAALLPSPVPGAQSTLSLMVTFVLISVAGDARAARRFAPVVVGLIVGFCVLTSGVPSAASVLPARSLGPVGDAGPRWAYSIAPIVAMLVAARSYEALRGSVVPRSEPREIRRTRRRLRNVVDDARQPHALRPGRRRSRAHTVIRPA